MKVVFRPQAVADLDRLFAYVLEVSASPVTAEKFLRALQGACLSLAEFPLRGTMRDDIQKGLRVLIVDGRSVIAYRVVNLVEILAVFHAGQNWTEYFVMNGDQNG